MIKVLSITILALWAGVSSEASMMCVNGATFDTYIGTTCMVGPLTFSGFNGTYMNATDLGGNPIMNSSVTVTVVNNPATGTYGLLFSYPGGGGLAVRPPAAPGTATISYNVMGQPVISANLTMTGGRMGNGAESGVGETANGVQLSTVAQGPLSDTEELGLPTMFSVMNTATVSAPNGSMQSQVQSVQNTFMVTPEPGSLILLTFGCAAMWRMRQRHAG